MACNHVSCQCEVQGCGLTHPADWVPVMKMAINAHEVGGDDHADCMAHYLLSVGYPRDRPEHLRQLAESHVAKHPLPRTVTQK